jgi:hypothetical protein
VKLGEGKLAGYKLAHLTGTGAFTWSAAEVDEVRAFLDKGGTLLVDAAGGSDEFAKAAERELARLVPGVGLEAIAPEDPLLSDTHPLAPPEADLFGAPAAQAKKPPPPTDKPLDVEYRRWAKNHRKLGTDLQLKGVPLGGRWAVIYSPVDFSAGLVGQSIEGVIGYTPAAATEMIRRIIVNAR